MPNKIEHDTERWLRSNAELYRRKGNQQMARNFELCAEDVKRLRSELAALKAAARAALIDWRCCIITSQSDAYNALAALVGGGERMKISFDRKEYLSVSSVFENESLDDVNTELSEFNDDITDMAYELAYTRYALAKIEARYNKLREAVAWENMLKCADEIERLREFIRNGVELGYIVIPDKGDPARDIIDRICGGEK
jgi:multidrug resistance efflux pump